MRYLMHSALPHKKLVVRWLIIKIDNIHRCFTITTKMNISRHCDKCNLEAPYGTVLTGLCVDHTAHHLVDNIAPGILGNNTIMHILPI